MEKFEIILYKDINEYDAETNKKFIKEYVFGNDKNWQKRVENYNDYLIVKLLKEESYLVLKPELNKENTYSFFLSNDNSKSSHDHFCWFNVWSNKEYIKEQIDRLL